MNILKKVYCRGIQFVFKIALPFLPYRKPIILQNANDIANVLKEKNINSLLLISGKNVRKNNLTLELEDALKEKNINYYIYDSVTSNPETKVIEAAKEVYLSNNCQAIIGFGGGSQIDTAKALGALIVYPKKRVKDLKGTMKVLRKIPLLFAVPTTAGSGSEATVASVVTDSETHHKYTLNNFTMIPKYAVLDPKLTYTLPKHLTSTTGMDALTHAVEAYIGRSTTKSTRKDSIEAVKLIFDNILTAYNNPLDSTARSNMLKASYLAGCAFTKSYVGYIHAISHPLSGKYNTPHGLANSVVMPYVLEEYGKCVYKKLYRLAMEVNLVDSNDTYEVGAKKFIHAIKELNMKMDIPNSFDFIKEEDINEMSRYADNEANPLYPVPTLWNREKIARIYQKISKI
jgi:alcohol dehydrogenase class IV